MEKKVKEIEKNEKEIIRMLNSPNEKIRENVFLYVRNNDIYLDELAKKYNLTSEQLYLDDISNKSIEYRLFAAESNFCKNVFYYEDVQNVKYKPEEYKIAMAELGIFSEEFAKDTNPEIREAVARSGNCLDELIKDNNSLVRITAAKEWVRKNKDKIEKVKNGEINIENIFPMEINAQDISR